MKARGVDRVAVEALPSQPSEEFYSDRMEEAGLGGTRDRYGISVLAIRRGREPILFPAKDEEIQSGDILYVAGRDELLDRLRRGDPPARSRAKASSRAE